MNGPGHGRDAPSDVIRTVLDDRTVERLRTEAEALGMGIEELVVALLTAASRRPREVLASGEDDRTRDESEQNRHPRRRRS